MPLQQYVISMPLNHFRPLRKQTIALDDHIDLSDTRLQLRSEATMYTTHIAIIALLLPFIHAHGSHDTQKPLQPSEEESDWATLHMASEHHIANLDPPSFFSLHDYDANGVWTKDEIRRTYGLDDESTKDVNESKKAEDVGVVLTIFDRDGDGSISRDEFVEGWKNEGKRLPDFGVSDGRKEKQRKAN